MVELGAGAWATTVAASLKFPGAGSGAADTMTGTVASSSPELEPRCGETSREYPGSVDA